MSSMNSNRLDERLWQYTKCENCGQNAVIKQKALCEQDNRVYDYSRCLSCGKVTMTAEQIGGGD